MRKKFPCLATLFCLVTGLLFGCGKNPVCKVNVYYIDPNQEKLLSKQISVNAVKDKSGNVSDTNKDSQEKILSELKKSDVLDESAKINNLSVIKEDNDDKQNQNKILLIDFSNGFVDLTELGSESEDLALNAIAKTFGEFYGVQKVKLTVDGENYESGHIELNQEDYFYVD